MKIAKIGYTTTAGTRFQKGGCKEQVKTTSSKYRIGGLMGEHCVDRIEHTLSQHEGAKHVNVDQNNKQVSVEYDPNVIKSGYIEETLQTLGYSIRE